MNFCDADAKYCTDIHLLGTSQLTSVGKATLKFRPGAGNHGYKAVFAGTNTDAGSASSASALTVSGKTPTAAAITETGIPGNYTLTATVGGQGGTSAPTGTVSFLDTSYSNAVVATGQLGIGVSELNFLRSEAIDTDNQSTSVTVGDFNGDGIPDLAVASYFDGVVSILLGNGDGTFTPATNSPITGLFDPRSIIVGDFNGDGKADIAFLVGYYSGGVAIYLGNGDGTFTVAPKSPVSVGVNFSEAVAAGDFNGDGIADLAVSSDDGGVYILIGKGDGTSTITSGSPTYRLYKGCLRCQPPRPAVMQVARFRLPVHHMGPSLFLWGDHGWHFCLQEMRGCTRRNQSTLSEVPDLQVKIRVSVLSSHPTTTCSAGE